MKKVICLVAAFCTAVIAFGQTPLPNDPEVMTGKLENGMTYYIRHNDLPQGRAEFYLATNVGAIQEAPDQDGLAHFLEHMCFNGLKNLPGKQMLDYLQHIGAEFGRNINASTGVEHTQYMLNNMPIHREGILDTCLLVMHDYSHFVLNDPVEIDAERGVILEEKRTRNTAGWRMFEKCAPYIYGEDCKYAHCNIIGSEENLKNFKPESLVNFYQTWYRPDMQAIIVVGDIDVMQVYNKIVDLFADIPAPEQPTVKVMPEVEMNTTPKVGIVLDPENTSTSVEFIWKLGAPTPKEIKGTDMGYLESLIKLIIYNVMNERLSDIAAKADAPFMNAGFYIANLCETCEVIEGEVDAENAKIKEAVRAYLTEIEKLRRYGITDDEADRVKADIIKNIKDKVAGKDTRKNPEFIRPIMNNFFNGTPYLQPELEQQLLEYFCANINAEFINQLIPQLINGEYFTMIYQGVDQPGQVHPTEDELLAIAEEVKNAEIEANAVEAINKDFMAGIELTKGHVVEAPTGIYESYVWNLSNGMKVVVLPTEYKKNEIIFDLRREGGLSVIPTEDIQTYDRNILQLFFGNSGIADYSATTVSKMLSGKSVHVSPYISQIANGVNGRCTPEDLETALQMVNLIYTHPRFDQDEWNLGVNQLKAYLPNMLNTPDYAFSKHLYDAIYGSPRFQMISNETLENASLETFKKYYPALFGSVNGATLYIAGDVDVYSLRAFVEEYIASIEGGEASSYNAENLLGYTKGVHKDVFQATMNTPKVSVFQFYNAAVPYSVQRAVDLDAASFILDMIYTATLREEEGGTYGASSYMQLSYYPEEEAMIQVSFDTNVDQQEKLRELAVKGITGLALNGPTEEQLTRAIENAKKNLPEKRITNNYWMNNLKYYDLRAEDYDALYEQAINNITAEGIKQVLSEILLQYNFSEVVMTPAE